MFTARVQVIVTDHLELGALASIELLGVMERYF